MGPWREGNQGELACLHKGVGGIGGSSGSIWGIGRINGLAGLQRMLEGSWEEGCLSGGGGVGELKITKSGLEGRKVQPRAGSSSWPFPVLGLGAKHVHRHS